MAEHDDEIFSVLLHEIGHVEHRHSLRQVISHSGLAVMTVLITGDVNSAGGLILALPNLLVSSSYSRDLEWEADGYALERMQDLGMPPSRFADFMEKLEHSVPKHKDSDEDPESIVLNDELADKDSQVDKPKLECAPKEEADEGIIDLGWFDYIASHPPSAERIARFREAETLR